MVTSLVAQTVRNLPTVQETWVYPWVAKIPWWGEWLPTPVFLPGELASVTHWTWIWASSRRWWRTGKLVCFIVHGFEKSQTWLSNWITKASVLWIWEKHKSAHNTKMELDLHMAIILMPCLQDSYHERSIPFIIMCLKACVIYTLSQNLCPVSVATVIRSETYVCCHFFPPRFDN